MKTLNKKLSSDDSGSANAFQVFNEPLGMLYKVNVLGIIEAPEQFDLAVDVLDAANENDVVEIHLNTGGGRLDATQYLLHSMAKTAAKVRVVATGCVASAGTLIILSADEIEVAKFTEFMFHTASYGSYGKVGEVASQVEFSTRALKRLIGDIYEGFFTAKEIKKLHAGQDYWMNEEEFLVRLQKKFELLESRMPKQE